MPTQNETDRIMVSTHSTPFRSALVVLGLLLIINGSVPAATVSAAPGSCRGLEAPPGVSVDSERRRAEAELRRDGNPGSRALAVVYRREAERSSFLGSTPLASGALARLDGEGVPGNAEQVVGDPSHEIYVLHEGVTRAYAFWSDAGVYSADLREETTDRVFRRDGERILSSIVKNAAQPAIHPSRPSADFVTRVGFGVAGRTDLVDLCQRSGVIAIGRIAGVLREAFTPINGTGPRQHTVYAFAVQEYLKALPSDGQPLWPVLKVYEFGGNLPFAFHQNDREIRGTGHRSEGAPPLFVGSEYILFLYLPDPGPDRHRGYRFGGSGGVYGKIAELDEYVLTAPWWRAAVLLRDGYTWAPEGDGAPVTRPLPPDKLFREGPEILGQPVGNAVQMIREALASSAR